MNASAKIAAANVEIAKLTDKTATAERDAALARLEQERLKSVVSWRTIPPENLNMLAVALGKVKGDVALRYIASDAESLGLASQISRLSKRPIKLLVRRFGPYIPILTLM